jgi:branched-chain amino acid transport system ATP-binding protein
MTEILLRVDGVYKYFGGVRAVDGVSFSLGRGERFFVVGPNGAGKTTLVNLISGYFKPDRGRILFKGEDVTALGLTERVRRGIARSFQLVTVFDNLTVAENIAVSVASRLGRSRVAYKTLSSYRDVVEEVERILEVFELADVASKYPTELSQGDRKILDVALTFALKPSLIILDEPTSGVATKDKHSVMERLIKAFDVTGVSSIIVEHDMDIVFRYARRVVVMHEGRVLADGDPASVRGNEEVRRILLGGVYA